MAKWDALRNYVDNHQVLGSFLLTGSTSQTREDEGAKTLKLLKAKIGKNKLTEPSFLMVITATGYAHKREDGVYVVPIGC